MRVRLLILDTKKIVFRSQWTEISRVTYRGPDMARYLRAIGTSLILQSVGFRLLLRKTTSTSRDWSHLDPASPHTFANSSHSYAQQFPFPKDRIVLARPMHVGHLRAVQVGDGLPRRLTFHISLPEGKLALPSFFLGLSAHVDNPGLNPSPPGPSTHTCAHVASRADKQIINLQDNTD